MTEPGIIEVGNLRIDTAARQVWIGGRRMHFGSKEYEIIALLARRRGEVFSKEALTEHLYGRQLDPEVKVVDVFITRMRKMMAPATGGAGCIETVWGEGYRLRTPGAAAD